MQALKQMGLSKVDVEEVEELARSVARQIRAQMDVRGRFQGVNQERILSELKKQGGLSAHGEDVDKDAAVEKVHDQKIDNIESSEDDLVIEESSKSVRRRRGVSLSAGLQFEWGGHNRRRHKHGALRLNVDKYHHGGRYGEEGHYDDYSHFDQDYHHDNHHSFGKDYHHDDRHSFSKDYHYGDYHHYDDHHHHHGDHRRLHHDDYHDYHHY